MDPVGVRILGLVGRSDQAVRTVADAFGQLDQWTVINMDDAIRAIMLRIDPLIMDDAIPGGLDSFQRLVDDEGFNHTIHNYPEAGRIHQEVRNALGLDGIAALYSARVEAALAQGQNVATAGITTHADIDAVHELGGLVANVYGTYADEKRSPDYGLEGFSGALPIMADGGPEVVQAAVQYVAEALRLTDPVTGKPITIGRS